MSMKPLVQPPLAGNLVSALNEKGIDLDLFESVNAFLKHLLA